MIQPNCDTFSEGKNPIAFISKITMKRISELISTAAIICLITILKPLYTKTPKKYVWPTKAVNLQSLQPFHFLSYQ